MQISQRAINTQRAFSCRVLCVSKNSLLLLLLLPRLTLCGRKLTLERFTPLGNKFCRICYCYWRFVHCYAVVVIVYSVAFIVVACLAWWWLAFHVVIISIGWVCMPPLGLQHFALPKEMKRVGCYAFLLHLCIVSILLLFSVVLSTHLKTNCACCRFRRPSKSLTGAIFQKKFFFPTFLIFLIDGVACSAHRAVSK